MKLLAKFFSEVGTTILLSRVKRIEIEPPDLIIQYPNAVVLSRMLVCRDVEYDVEDALSERSRVILEEYIALLKSLPSRVHVYLYKEEFDLNSFLKKLRNSILNVQADLELAREEPEKLKLKVKLDKLKSLYNSIVEGKPFLKVVFAIVFRVESKDKDTAKSLANYYESIITSIFKSNLGLKLERADYTEIVSFILNVLGLDTEARLPGIHVEAYKLAHLQPVTLDKPALAEPGILLGFEKDTKHPVILQLKYLYHHVAIIGPTGRGKSTLLASLVEQLISEGFCDIIVIDFKGDLKRYILDNLIPVLAPSKAPISILKPPPGIEHMSWRKVVIESLSYTSGVNPDSILRALLVVEKNAEDVFKDPSAAAIIPFMEFVDTNTNYEWIDEHLVRSGSRVLIDLEGRGTVYQNTYASLFLGVVRHLLLGKTNDKGLLLVVDDAWRILRLKTLLEIVREGRSRRVGVVLSSQGPEDFPNEILENVYNIVVFGSKNEEYLDKVRRILGTGSSLVSMLSKLGIGEAVYVNATSKNIRILDIHVPLKMKNNALNNK